MPPSMHTMLTVLDLDDAWKGISSFTKKPFISRIDRHIPIGELVEFHSEKETYAAHGQDLNSFLRGRYWFNGIGLQNHGVMYLTGQFAGKVPTVHIVGSNSALLQALPHVPRRLHLDVNYVAEQIRDVQYSRVNQEARARV